MLRNLIILCIHMLYTYCILYILHTEVFTKGLCVKDEFICTIIMCTSIYVCIYTHQSTQTVFSVIMTDESPSCVQDNTVLDRTV